jgi:hypothetical protein
MLKRQNARGLHNNPNGRPNSDTVRLTRAARERFDRQLAEGIDDIFKALFEAATKDKDTAALGLLVNRAVPVRRGAVVAFQHRSLHTPQDCAAAFDDILAAVGRGELTPDEGNALGALVERRVGLFHTVELQDEIAALRGQIFALTPQTLRVVQ